MAGIAIWKNKSRTALYCMLVMRDVTATFRLYMCEFADPVKISSIGGHINIDKIGCRIQISGKNEYTEEKLDC
jgi:hypothetical protein